MCEAATSESAVTAVVPSDTGSNSFRSGEGHSEQEYVLSELETSDSGSIGIVLRVIYDGGDVAKFVRSLERKIANYDKEIEKLCSFHYHSFVESVQELLELKAQCTELKTDISTIDKFLKENSKVMLQRAEQILSERKLQRNIGSAVDAVSLCLPALEKYSKLVEQMESKK
ncbi:unnamed protein product [Soboliphyme baturini]|uniref:Exocyst complex component 6B n=1 Tax=Soboliphyme baturini TaxID=241478 RepID=A0A183IM44_9BILA|nr:unnamed protein product [Soboliphyme baturini]